MRNSQSKYDRRKGSKLLLKEINFPDNLIDDKLLSFVEEIMYESDKKANFFKTFTQNNNYNGKFKFNLTNENKNFNIKPLFEMYNKNEKICKDYLNTNLNLIFKEIQLKRLLNEKIYLGLKYKKLFFKEAEIIQTITNKQNISNFCFQVLEKNSIASKNYMQKIKYEQISTLKKFLDLFKKLYSKYLLEYKNSKKINIFSYTTEDVYLESLVRLYFFILNFVYQEFLKNDKNKLENLKLKIKELEKIEPIPFKKSNSCQNTFLGFLSLYQIKKINSENSKSLELLTTPESLKKWKKMKIPPDIFFRIDSKKNSSFLIKNFNKKELFNEISNNSTKSSYSHFKKDLKQFEKFLDIMSVLGLHYQKENLRTYGLLYQEIMEHNEKFGEKGTKKIVCDIINGKGYSQSELYFISHKMNRILFITDYSEQNFKENIKFKLNIHDLLFKHLSERNGENIDLIITKFLNVYEENFKEGGVKYGIVNPDLQNKFNVTFPYC